MMPPCPHGRVDCRFVGGLATSTAMYDPIERDRDGKPVGGGGNERYEEMSCRACGTKFARRGRELDFAQGKVEWKPEP